MPRHHKPTRLKILEGNPGKRPLNKAEPEPAPGAPDCPSWLDREGKAIWRSLVPDFAPGLLCRVDGEVLAMLCQAVIEHRWATRELRKKKRTYTTEQGQVCPHPAVAMQRSAWLAVRSFSALFGLDPSSRSRLRVDKPKPSKLSKFFA